jgi:uncharacterized protein (TIGR02147 family)
MLNEYDDYRHYLRDVLEDRSRRNQSYSLRAFARDLGMSAARLSEVLNHKKGLSVEAGSHIAEALGLNRKETQYLCDLVQLRHARSESARKIASARIKCQSVKEPKQLADDIFYVISEWYHFAILELTFIDGFKSDVKWIARSLLISQAKAKLATNRLIRLGLLQKVKGTLVKTDKYLTTSDGIPSEAIRHLTRQLLQKAGDALEVQPIDDRDFSTVTMAIDKNRIPEAKRIIADCRRALIDLLESGCQTDLYCFSAQLFRISDVRS